MSFDGFFDLKTDLFFSYSHENSRAVVNDTQPREEGSKQVSHDAALANVRISTMGQHTSTIGLLWRGHRRLDAQGYTCGYIVCAVNRSVQLNAHVDINYIRLSHDKEGNANEQHGPAAPADKETALNRRQQDSTQKTSSANAVLSAR